MAIIFARLDPIHLTPRSGAARIIAYTGRTVIADRGSSHDYRHLANDLVHEEVMLPAGYPAEFNEPEILAGALDGAELKKVRTPLEQRDRLPQVGLILTIALPPNEEVFVHEAAEIVRRIVNAARGSHQIPIHFAIHDSEHNRHGHAMFAQRVFDAAGAAGPKLRDMIVRVRPTAIGMAIVEGIDWPALVWEIQQVFFAELGVDLVVDPIAPAPGRHLSPVVYGLGAKSGPDSKRDEDYELTRSANIVAIQDSPTVLIETLLRGRTSLPVAEIERLCAKFFDSTADQREQINRILLDENIITLADVGSAYRPSYATTQRVYRLITRAVTLVEHSSTDRMVAITGSDHALVVAQVAELCTVGCNAPLILGNSLSDCSAVEAALAAHRPVAGTIDIAITGSQALREKGRARDVRLRQGRLVIVPHAERIDDRRLARLIVAVERVGGGLILGHDQSVGTGVVCRRLASYAADRVEHAPADLEPVAIERLLRSGLIARAVAAMAVCGRLEFGIPPGQDSNTVMFVACDDPRRITDVSEATRRDRVRAGMIGRPTRLEGARGPLELSVGEWVVATESVQGEPGLEGGQFAQISSIDQARNTIAVEHNHVLTRIDLGSKIAIRPAAAISIREARGLFADAPLIVELTDPRRAWPALLLAAQRGEYARLRVAPAAARDPVELIDAARRCLPAAFPHWRSVLGDPDAELSSIIPKVVTQLPDLELFPDQAAVHVDAPPRINATENVRNMLSSNVHARLGYQLLYRHVGYHNPNSAANLEHVLGLCSSELSRLVTRHLAGIELNEADDNDLAVFDLPSELTELEPRNFDLFDVERLKLDLWTMTIPGSVWGTRAAFKFRARPLSEPLDDAATNSI
jgi:MobA/MobL family